MKLSDRRRLYLLLLSLVLLVHTFVLVLKIQQQNDIVQDDPESQLKVRILKELSKKQIVRSEDPEKDARPTDEAFLSDRDRKFDRETIAKKVDTFKKAAKGGRPESGNQSKKKASEEVKLSDIGAFAADHDPFKKAAKEYSQKGATSAPGKNNGDPESDTMVSSTNDYIEKVPLGDVTHLNTTEYKYYGFYHRIRQKLEQFWGRSIYEKAEQMGQEGRRLIASEDHITALQIILDSKGRILAIKIMGSSGVKELDDAAIESFNEAGPFPNPPRDLVVNGKVTLEWGFIVQT